MLNRLFITACIAVCTLYACTGKDVFLQYRDIPLSGWHCDSACIFDVPVDDISLKYNVYINIRNTANYPNQNLWLFVKMSRPDSTSMQDTLNFYLADERGKWLGSGIGNSYSMPVFYLREKQFRQAGNYRFEIRHAMRCDLLRGISNAGLRVEKIPLK
jgi:gliding motility-associated lipoprotein GldH